MDGGAWLDCKQPVFQAEAVDRVGVPSIHLHDPTEPIGICAAPALIGRLGNHLYVVKLINNLSPALNCGAP